MLCAIRDERGECLFMLSQYRLIVVSVIGSYVEGVDLRSSAGSRRPHTAIHVGPDDGQAVMAERVRRRNRERLDHAEDLLARETDFDMGSSGPHFPNLFPRFAKGSDYSDGEDGDDHRPLIDEPEVDLSKSWFQRTRESLKGDVSSIALLLFLYMLQGIPLGLIAAIPLVLQDKGVSYAQQAVFSFAYWPFSVKLLWAPVVDSVYWKWMGRRKSWMVPCQYLIGLFMLGLSFRITHILGEGISRRPFANGTLDENVVISSDGDGTPNVFFLMLLFLPLNFFAATQDIAVDGWALTILSRKNVGYASTCNAVGQTAGFFLGNIVFLTLESKTFANKFRSADNQLDHGFVDLAGYLFFWGCVFIVSTTLVWIFKKEVDLSQTPTSQEAKEDEELELGIVETYTVLWKILRLKPMIVMLAVLLTGKFAFAATDGITGFKLLAMGVRKDTLASFGLFLTPLQVLLPWVIGKWTAGPRPLNIFLWAYPYRLLVGVGYALLVYFTPALGEKKDDKTTEFQFIFYVIWIAAYVFHQIASYSMFVSAMAFNAQISDPRIGGTYMTLLNTLNNLGGNWPVTLVLSITDRLTWKQCMTKEAIPTMLYACNSKELADKCSAAGDVCSIQIDGYYLSVAFCTVVGLIWFKILFPRIKRIQRLPRKEWHVIKSNNGEDKALEAHRTDSD